MNIKVGDIVKISYALMPTEYGVITANRIGHLYPYSVRSTTGQTYRYTYDREIELVTDPFELAMAVLAT